MLGIMRENQRMEGNVISDALNLASRLESLTKVYGSKVIISQSAFYKELSSKFKHRKLDRV